MKISISCHKRRNPYLTGASTQDDVFPILGEYSQQYNHLNFSGSEVFVQQQHGQEIIIDSSKEKDNQPAYPEGIPSRNSMYSATWRLMT